MESTEQVIGIELDMLDRQCAEALGWTWEGRVIIRLDDGTFHIPYDVGTNPYYDHRLNYFSPTRNPAQAMALLEILLENGQMEFITSELTYYPDWKRNHYAIDMTDEKDIKIAITRATIAWKAS